MWASQNSCTISRFRHNLSLSRDNDCCLDSPWYGYLSSCGWKELSKAALSASGVLTKRNPTEQAFALVFRSLQ